MSEKLTAKEVEQWREEVRERAAWHHPDVLRVFKYMIELHDERERLRKVTHKDITDAQQQQLEKRWSWMANDTIAAVVRVILNMEGVR